MAHPLYIHVSMVNNNHLPGSIKSNFNFLQQKILRNIDHSDLDS
jgi:hypothetical protein